MYILVTLFSANLVSSPKLKVNMALPDYNVDKAPEYDAGDAPEYDLGDDSEHDSGKAPEYGSAPSAVPQTFLSNPADNNDDFRARTVAEVL